MARSNLELGYIDRIWCEIFSTFQRIYICYRVNLLIVYLVKRIKVQRRDDEGASERMRQGSCWRCSSEFIKREGGAEVVSGEIFGVWNIFGKWCLEKYLERGAWKNIWKVLSGEKSNTNDHSLPETPKCDVSYFCYVCLQ